MSSEDNTSETDEAEADHECIDDERDERRGFEKLMLRQDVKSEADRSRP